MESDWLRYAGIALNAAGSMLLAFRVTRILRALALVAQCHEANLQSLSSQNQVVLQFTNSDQHVKRAQGFGLLILGFGSIIVGLLLQGLAIYLTTNQ
jgi:hypothetical protein